MRLIALQPIWLRFLQWWGVLSGTHRFLPSSRLKQESNIKNVWCVRETEILVEQQTPQGVFVCDHAGFVINEFSILISTLVPEEDI